VLRIKSILNKLLRLLRGFAVLTTLLVVFYAPQSGVVAANNSETVSATTSKGSKTNGNKTSAQAPAPAPAPKPSSPPAAAEFENKIKEFQEYVSTARKKWKCPGVSIGIIANGKVYFVNDGVANVDTGKKITEDSIFCVMSLSKVITVSVVQQLVDEGKLNLDDPVTNYLPWFKLSAGTQDVKVRHLISHCIGLPKFAADTLWHLGFTQKEIIEKLGIIPVCAPPGEKYAYQNMFVGIAGLLIESILKKPLRDIVQERIFEKLGMEHSSMGPHPTGFWGKIKQFFKKEKKHDPDLLVTGYINYGGPAVSVSTDEPYLFEGTSGVNSSTADYLKFIACLINGGIIESGVNAGTALLSQRAMKEMTSKQIAISDIRNNSSHFPVERMEKGSFYYGNGIFGFNYGTDTKKAKVIMHEGAGAGWRSIWMILPEHNFGFVVLTNYGSINSNLLPEAIAYQLLDLYLNIPGHNWNDWFYKSFLSSKKYFKHRFDAYVLGPPPPLESLSGKYKSEIYGALTIVQKGGGLVAEYRGRDVPLKHVGGTVFSFDANKLTVRYGDDDYGELYFQRQGNKVDGLKVGLLREDDFKKS
jgi:CubicO group peptidase (beta-lactamase class C family)